jgi:WD repeat and SOF domain-containing protein 1
MDRMFAHPFIAAMSEHSDGVYCSATSPASLVAYVSGAADGEAIVWDLSSRKKLWSVYAHTGFVRGLTVSPEGSHFISCGDDKSIKQWRMAADEKMAIDDGPAAASSSSASRASAGAAPASSSARSSRMRDVGDDSDDESGVEPVNVWSGKHAFTSVDHHAKDYRFATASTVVSLWDYNRSEPVHTYEWGADTVTCVRYNPAEVRICANQRPAAQGASGPGQAWRAPVRVAGSVGVVRPVLNPLTCSAVRTHCILPPCPHHSAACSPARATTAASACTTRAWTARCAR